MSKANTLPKMVVGPRLAYLGWWAVGSSILNPTWYDLIHLRFSKAFAVPIPKYIDNINIVDLVFSMKSRLWNSITM